MVIICLLFGISRKRRNQIEQREQTKDLFSAWSFDRKMTYENIIIATEGFNSKYCIGNGGQGSVFKVELPSGQVVTVKKFHPLHSGELNSLKIFENETKTLLKIRHRNIVKLYGFCSHERHSFLVYEFLEGGNLSERLRNDEKATELDWIKRVSIVRGVAYALSYMHHECSPPILHRDISSKNVLLDHEDRPHLSDFCTAKLLRPNSSNWTSFAGTFGYVAPGES
ncbi:MDIS1-interacting receptor like kinase 2-like [Lycium barbarum]|uniref:MDIS1-interacting receptor like kinase 2-like n=1 Tax=Lycium barbarum TaxID=112863 RepID=UPI00293E2090|nr:MDIS1-interacting receptor like kinase 2-like [Lycium barbarum]